MDDNQTYLLNGLITRHFGVGRIVRFRQVERGRQAESFELFTAQEKEYLVQLYPPAFAAEHLEFVARAVNALDANRFSVVPFLASRARTFVTEGPQGRHMLLALAPAGSPLVPLEYTEHEISQVGLRLAWMHRLLMEQVQPPADVPSIADRFYDQFFQTGPQGERPNPAAGGKFAELHAMLRNIPSTGWVHGAITP
ncbi:MAG TPA: hypothetical protein VHM90_09610, partial [Phycisphaerae bacterium]|nr:hypothetical protein [Phycisphaerae bacterium]